MGIPDLKRPLESGSVETSLSYEVNYREVSPLEEIKECCKDHQKESNILELGDRPSLPGDTPVPCRSPASRAVSCPLALPSWAHQLTEASSEGCTNLPALRHHPDGAGSQEGFSASPLIHAERKLARKPGQSRQNSLAGTTRAAASTPTCEVESPGEV